MNVPPDSSNVNYVKGVFGSLLPFIVTLIGAILSRAFTNPTDEETRLSRLKCQLLSVLRLKLSTEVSEIIPPKTIDINEDDYLLLCRDSLNDYFSRTQTIVRDLLTCEGLFKSLIKTLRILKYVMILAPTVGIAYFILAIVFGGKEIHTWIHLLVSLGLFGTVIIVWIIVEFKKDEAHDLCAKYEVTDERPRTS